MDAADNSIYVADTNNNRIQKFASQPTNPGPPPAKDACATNTVWPRAGLTSA